MASFELNIPGHYTVKLAEPITEFEPDQYGNIWHNVLFDGDAETYMWLAKNPPEEGKTYYGHIEKTKSGKRLRFKTDKLPEGAPAPSNKSASGDNKYLKDVSDMPFRVWQQLLNHFDVQNLMTNKAESAKFWEAIQYHTDELLDIIDKVRNSDIKPSTEAPKSPEDVSLGDKSRARKTVTANDEPEYGDSDIPPEFQ